MRIIILAFIISISLHFFLFHTYKNEEPKEENQKEEISQKKSDVKFVKLKPKEIVEEKKIEPEIKKVEKKVEEPKIQKEVKKEPIKKESPLKEIPKKVETTKQIDIQKSQKIQEKILDEQIVNKEESIQNKTLENFLAQKEPVNQEVLNELEKLYGKEYESFTKVQKAYLEKNLNNFQVITQRVLNRLGYPRLAAKLKLQGANIVEFMFHPDGSITDLKITNSSGYSVFDEYSLELIEIAYKDYPKPTTTTKLKFNVKYSLY